MSKKFTDIKISELFYRSAIEQKAQINNTRNVHEWIKEQNDRIKVNIDKIPFYKLKKWNIGKQSISHDTGMFFSIEGLKAKLKYNDGNFSTWSQPIINQPEIGFLGFLTKSINGVLHFLTQAKIEPGNVNNVQLSPTLQATRSNYIKAHKGKSPNYLNYFMNAKIENILFDQIQSEQGSRFLKKRNRNIIIYTTKEIKLKKNYIWLTLAQLKYFMSFDNLVNMDTRTVLSGINFLPVKESKTIDNEFYSKFGNIFFESLSNKKNQFYQLKDIHSKMSNFKSQISFSYEKTGIKQLDCWKITDFEISHKDKNFFKVIGVDVTISNREVSNWCQPMIEPSNQGYSVFVTKMINGILHFIVQLKFECGLIDLIELAPTLQTSMPISSKNFKDLSFSNYINDSDNHDVIFDNLQSEEGGRFYKEQNRNMIILTDDQIDLKPFDNFVWMTLNQLNSFIKFTNLVNIQARNLVAQTRFIDVK